MRELTARTGARMPVLGLGTWEMGRQRRTRAVEVAALQLGYELGATLVDTAEMYADGGAEEVVAESLRGRRERVFVVTKVLPQNASRTGTVRAAERSLRRLGIDCIDLYLLHWPGNHPLRATLEAFEELRAAGKIRYWGVSNFDVQDMEQSESLPGGDRVAANQVYYNLSHRGIERRLLPWCRQRQVIVMAYSPLDQGRLRYGHALRTVARRRGVEPAQVALAWTLREPGVMAVPKAADSQHVRENVAAADLTLGPEDLALLDPEYRAPGRDEPLDTL